MSARDDMFKLLDTISGKGKRDTDVTPIIRAVVKGFEYDPGHSDLDDEQPINVRMLLGDWRKARRLLYDLEDHEGEAGDALPEICPVCRVRKGDECQCENLEKSQ